jgi:hypothetical protein
MPGDASPPHSLGVRNVVLSSQIRTANRTLNALPKVPSFLDVVPSFQNLIPKVEIPQVTTIHERHVRDLALRIEVPQVAALHARLVRDLVPKIEFPAGGAVTAQFTAAARIYGLMPKIEIPQAAALAPTLLRNYVPKVEIPQAVNYMASLINDLVPRWTQVQGWLSASLRIWRDLADAGKASAGWARRALRAARAARDAALNGDWGQVRTFLREWLGLRHPEEAHLQAAADALLEPGWEPEQVDLWVVSDMLADLKRETISGARRHRPVSQTQINGRFIVHLEQPITYQDGTSVTVLDQVRDETPVPEPPDYGFDDERLNRVLALMTPDERKVCLAYGGRGCTWAEAATTAGFPAEFGETVRRKRARLVNEVLRRASARR